MASEVTISELIRALRSRRSEFIHQRDEIDAKVRSIDGTIAAFENDAQAILPLNTPIKSVAGKYANSKPTEAIFDALQSANGRGLSAPELKKRLLNEGLQSTSKNFGTMIYAICARLALKGRIKSVKRGNTTIFKILDEANTA